MVGLVLGVPQRLRQAADLQCQGHQLVTRCPQVSCPSAQCCVARHIILLLLLLLLLPLPLFLAESHGAYDWHGDYVMIAVTSGNVPVLTELLSDGYELKWQQAQVRHNEVYSAHSAVLP